MKRIPGKFPLGGILVDAGRITGAQLKDALRGQQSSGRRLGEELIAAGAISRVHLEAGLSMQKKLIACALAITVGLAPITGLAPAAEAAQRGAAMAVSAVVVASARIQLTHQVRQVTISAADIARGYIEIPAAAGFAVTSNSRSGYLVELRPVGNLFESVRVSGMGRPVQLGADGGTIVQRGPLPPNLSHELDFHFTLRADVSPGTYPWPVHLAARALT
jgi:hypothetical protein